MKSDTLGMSARTRNALVFFSALLLLTLGAIAAYYTITRLLNAQHWVTHTRETQSALSNIATVISRAGRYRTEYVQSGDPKNLDEYQKAVQDTTQAVALVKQLTTDNEGQQNNCARLANLVDQRIDLMRQSIDLKRNAESDLVKQNQITLSIVRVAGEMDALIRQMQDFEVRLLTERQTRSENLFGQTVAVFFIAFLVSVLLLSLHYYLLNRELKTRQEAEAALRHLNARLLGIQDAERRKISRELHDSVGQYLAGAKMNLALVSNSLPPNASLADCVTILDKAIAETRTISHLLHPPLLDEVGFASAAKWYVEGFSERSGVLVSLNLPGNLARLPSTVELALFRLLQESLTNIHRHSRSTKAEIVVSLPPNRITLSIRDDGVGMTADVLERFQTDRGYVGVGLAGMRERVRELGGHIEVQSDSSGTVIVASLPVAARARKSDVAAAD
jgi:signal transduction histidine kinase